MTPRPTGDGIDRVWRRIRERLGVSARAFSINARNPNLLRAQLSFGAAWTSEWALTVVLAVVAYRDGGAEAAGIVAFIRLAPAAVIAPLGTALADRFPRDRVKRNQRSSRSAPRTCRTRTIP